MKQELQNTLKSDFEKYMHYAMKSGKGYGFEVFGDYVTSVLNFYVASSILNFENKLEASIFITELYNRGLGGVMNSEDVKELAQVFAQDPTLDYSIIKPIFD